MLADTYATCQFILGQIGPSTKFFERVDIHTVYGSISLLGCQVLYLGFKDWIDHMYDDLDDRSDAEIQALIRQLTYSQPKRIPVDRGLLPKLRIGSKPGLTAPFERGFENLNADIEITVKLPAYLVAGLMIEGELSDVLRIAGRDLLNARGKTWWHSRLSSVVAARNLRG